MSQDRFATVDQLAEKLRALQERGCGEYRVVVSGEYYIDKEYEPIVDDELKEVDLAGKG